MARKVPTQPKRDKSTNRAFVRWRGKKKYFGTWGSIEAARQFAAWYLVASSEKAPILDDVRPLVANCVNAFIRWARGYYTTDGKPNGEFANLMASASILIRLGYGADLADEFGPKRLLEIQATLSSEKSDKNPQRLKYARTTINSHVHRIRRVFRWCASREMIPASVVTGLEMVPSLAAARSAARESKPVKPVPIEHVIATLPFLSPTVSAMVRVQLLCGGRPQDVCRMESPAIDQTHDVWLYRPRKHKTAHRGKTLTKAIPKPAQAILAPFLKVYKTGPLFSPADSVEYWRSLERKPTTKAAVRRKRTPYKTGSYGKAIVYAIARAKKAGVKIPHWQPNQLRHLIATEVRGQSGVESAQLLLGHARPDMTLAYAEVTDAKLIDIGRKMVSPLETPKQPRRRGKSSDAGR